MGKRPWLVELAEGRAARWRPQESFPLPQVCEKKLRDGDTVAIVGGGLAGFAAARRLLMLSCSRGPALRVVMLDRPTCHYCGGLFTGRARRYLEEVLEVEFPRQVGAVAVRECLYLNPAGGSEVRLAEEALGVYRSDRFGGPGLDRALLSQVTRGLGEDKNMQCLKAAVYALEPGEAPGNWRLLYREASGGSGVVAARAILLAPGLALQQPWLASAAGRGRLRFPPSMAAGMWQLSTEAAVKNRLGQRLTILDGLARGCTVALIPQCHPWLTVATLGRHLSLQEVKALLEEKSVRCYLELPEVRVAPGCGGCRLKVFTGPSPACWGEGWAAIGDLAGYGRVFKDGYLTALRSGALAAEAMMAAGVGKSSFAAAYWGRARRMHQGNMMGRLLFRLSLKLSGRPWFSSWMQEALQGERLLLGMRGGYTHAGLSGLAGGELSYYWIAVFLVLGLAGRAVAAAREWLAGYLPGLREPAGR